MSNDFASRLRRESLSFNDSEPPPRTYVTKHGTKATSLRVAIRDLLNPEVADHGAVGRGRNRGDNITSKDKDRGTSESYTIRRLKRDNPDVARRAMEAKTLLTPKEAGEKGGRGNKGRDNNNTLSGRGTDPDYLTARIARDCQEVHEVMHSTSRSDQTGNKPEMAIGTLRVKRR